MAAPVVLALPAPPFEFNMILEGPFPRVPAIPAADLALTLEDFSAKYIVPAMQTINWSVMQDAETWDALGGDQWTPDEIKAMQG